MISFAGLRFFTTPWTLGISLALVAAAVVIGFVAWRRSGFSGIPEMKRCR